MRRSFKRKTSRKVKSRRIRRRSRSVKRSLKRSVKRSFKRKTSRKVKSRRVRSKNIQSYNCRIKPIDSKKYNIWDGGKNAELKVKYKIVELEGCGYCSDAKNLIKKKGYTLEVKKELNEEEEKEIMNTLGESYDYFPKIFEYDEKEEKYKFLGGYGKLKEKLN
jgi:glutaredoxin